MLFWPKTQQQFIFIIIIIIFIIIIIIIIITNVDSTPLMVQKYYLALIT